jgi:hypothetical protein
MVMEFHPISLLISMDHRRMSREQVSVKPKTGKAVLTSIGNTIMGESRSHNHLCPRSRARMFRADTPWQSQIAFCGESEVFIRHPEDTVITR